MDGCTPLVCDAIPGGVARPDPCPPKLLSKEIHVDLSTGSYPVLCCFPFISQTLCRTHNIKQKLLQAYMAAVDMTAHYNWNVALSSAVTCKAQDSLPS